MTGTQWVGGRGDGYEYQDPPTRAEAEADQRRDEAEHHPDDWCLLCRGELHVVEVRGDRFIIQCQACEAEYSRKELTCN